MLKTLTIHLFFLSFLLLAHESFGQVGASQLLFNDYLDLVEDHHPITYQAKLLTSQSQAVTMNAKGGFDPKAASSFDDKNFANKNYWNLLDVSLKVPTWYGVELKAGYNYANGEYINNADYIENKDLWNVGISIPLGKGLVIDERRAELKKAKIYNNVVALEQQLMVNQLVYDAIVAYLDWQNQYSNVIIAKEGVRLAFDRFLNTKTSFIQGDKPAIDTLETYLIYQTRSNELQARELDLANARIEINKYLWMNGTVPLELNADVEPEILASEIFENIVDELMINIETFSNTHPYIGILDNKVRTMDIDRKLAIEELKPDLRLQYNPLGNINSTDPRTAFRWTDNYKLGATFTYPIFLRKERSKLTMANIKIKDIEYARAQELMKIKVELQGYANAIQSYKAQTNLVEETVANYKKMLDAENERFLFGESSVFLVNTRESKYQESRIKNLEVNQKSIKSKLGLLYYAMRLEGIRK